MTTGIIQNSVNFVRPDYDNCPKCLLFDETACLFSNGDEIVILDTECSGLSYKNGYLLDIEFTTNKNCDVSDFFTVFVQQGSIENVNYVVTDIDDNGCIFVDELEISNIDVWVATKLYESETEFYKSLWVACNKFC